MKPPKTPKEFDYDLWTAEDGRCMVRVKRTGEVCEVDRPTFRLLRAEERRLRRSACGVPIECGDGARATLMSTNYVSTEGGGEMEGAWLIDPASVEDSVVTLMLEREFIKTLTPRQRDVYIQCVKLKLPQADYAHANGISRPRVTAVVEEIKEKAKNFFGPC